MADNDEATSAVAGVLGADADTTLLEYILSWLSPADTLRCSATSSLFATVAVSDGVWGTYCATLWEGKHVSPHFRDRGRMPRVHAYRDSLRDSMRTAITVDELCEFTWYHRMKRCAGPSWTDDDPWWNEDLWPFSDQQSAVDVRHYHQGGTTSGTRNGQPVEGRWRFVPDACGRTGPLGSFVRMSRGGRSFRAPSSMRAHVTGITLLTCECRARRSHTLLRALAEQLGMGAPKLLGLLMLLPAAAKGEGARARGRRRLVPKRLSAAAAPSHWSSCPPIGRTCSLS